MTNVELSPIQIANLSLHSVHFERADESLAEGVDESDYELSVSIAIGQPEHEPNDAIVRLVIEVDWEETPSPFQLSIEYRAFVRQDGSLDDEDFKRICRARITTIMLGSLRPMVRRLMSEADEPFRLPLFDLRELFNKSAGDE